MASRPIPREVIRGYVSGALVLTFFGALWAMLTIFSLSLFGRALLFALVGIGATPLVVACIVILRATHRLPTVASSHSTSLSKWFILVVGIECAAIALASNLLATTGHDEFIAPVTALIVGIQFLPLAALFQVRVYYLTGAALVLLATVAVTALLFGVTLGGVYTWSVVVGLGNTAHVLDHRATASPQPYTSPQRSAGSGCRAAP